MNDFYHVQLMGSKMVTRSAATLPVAKNSLAAQSALTVAMSALMAFL